MGWRWSLFSNVIKIIYSHRNIYIFFSRSMCLRMEKSTFTAEIKKTIHPSILTLLKECQRSVLFFHPFLRSVDMQSTNYVFFTFSSFFPRKGKEVHLGEHENLILIYHLTTESCVRVLEFCEYIQVFCLPMLASRQVLMFLM